VGLRIKQLYTAHNQRPHKWVKILGFERKKVGQKIVLLLATVRSIVSCSFIERALERWEVPVLVTQTNPDENPYERFEIMTIQMLDFASLTFRNEKMNGTVPVRSLP